MSKPVKQLVLERTRETLSDPKRWARLTRARSGGSQSGGRTCDELSPEATRFCAIGALHRHAFDLTGNRARAHRLMTEMRQELNALAGTPLSCVNDWHGRKAVVRLLDKAMSR